MQRSIETLVMSFQYPAPPNLPDPFLPASTGVHNLRHLGGYALNAPSAIGHLPSYCIKSHIIFRSAEPSRITPEGVALLDKYNVKTVFDLRAKSEIVKNEALTPLKTWDGAERVSVPCADEDEAGPERLAEKYKTYVGDGSEVSN
jgi:protein tyrosine/serine phosphatase